MYRKSIIRNLCKAVIDILLILISFKLAFDIRFDGEVPISYRLLFRQALPLALLIHFTVLFLINRYQMRWRYISLYDATAIGASSLLSIGIFASIMPIFFATKLPKGVLIINALLNLLFLLSGRLSVRVFHRRYRLWQMKDQEKLEPRRRVLIVGADHAGEQVARAVHQQAHQWELVGFVDDRTERQKSCIHGSPVLGEIKDLPRLLATLDIREVLVAQAALSKKRLAEIIQLCENSSARLSIIPGIDQLLNQPVSLNHVREIRVEDLLEREPVSLDIEQVRSFLSGERVLVTGAGGSIGSEICRQVAQMNPESLIMLGRGENSIFEAYNDLRTQYSDILAIPVIASVQDEERMRAVFEANRPTVVFHAAAHKHVPLMESHPTEAILNNVFGTRVVANLSDEYGVKKFVQISTDKVVNPTSVMGASKRIAEMVIQSKASSDTEFVAVRFGNVLESRGSVVPTMKRLIEHGMPVQVTDPEMTRYFMTIPEAVGLVLQAGSMGKSGEVFVLDMGSPVKILDLAKNLIRLSGKVPEKDIPIEIVGRRPGEKLHEELMTAEEGIAATLHERIFVSQVDRMTPAEYNATINDLRMAVKISNDDWIRWIFKCAIPTYQPPQGLPSPTDGEIRRWRSICANGSSVKVEANGKSPNGDEADNGREGSSDHSSTSAFPGNGATEGNGNGIGKTASKRVEEPASPHD